MTSIFAIFNAENSLYLCGPGTLLPKIKWRLLKDLMNYSEISWIRPAGEKTLTNYFRSTDIFIYFILLYFWFSKSLYFLKFYFIVVQLQLSPFSPPITLPCPTHPPPPTFNPFPPRCLCPWVLYTCSLTWPFTDIFKFYVLLHCKYWSKSCSQNVFNLG